jgi:hypothetical protein
MIAQFAASANYHNAARGGEDRKETTFRLR